MDSYNNNSSHPLLNKGIQSAYAPGSTFKMVTAIAGLESGNITLTERLEIQVFMKNMEESGIVGITQIIM